MLARGKNISGRLKRKARVRKKISGTVARLRLNVYRSNKHIYAQLVEDTAGRTVLAASTTIKALRGETSKLNKTDAAKRVGEYLGGLAKEKGVDKVVFDRSGYLYHGRVKALADGMRSAGISF